MSNYYIELLREVDVENIDKEDIIKEIGKIKNLSEIVRHKGLLELDSYIDDFDNILYNLIIQQITDGLDPRLLEEYIISLLYSTNFKSDTEKFKLLIIGRGMTFVQTGMNPEIIEDMLYGYLGVNKAEEKRKQRNQVDYMLEEWKRNLKLSDEYSEIKIDEVDNDYLYSVISKIIRDMGMYGLACALYIHQNLTLYRIINCLPYTQQKELLIQIKSGPKLKKEIEKYSDEFEKLVKEYTE